MGRPDHLEDLQIRLEKVRASIDRLKVEEVRLTHHLRIVQAHPNIKKYLEELGCRNIDTGQLRFSILEYSSSMLLGMTTEQIWQNIRSIYPKITYGNLRVNLSRMNELGHFESKRRGGKWILSHLGKIVLSKILYDDRNSFNAKEPLK